MRPAPAVPALFVAQPERDGERLEPLPFAASQWGDGRSRLRGMAVSGALARAAERTADERTASTGRPARWTVDLFRPAALQACTVRSEVVRRGRRLCVIDVFLDQDQGTVARGRGLFLVPPTHPPAQEVWTPHDEPSPPPPELVPASDEPRLYGSDGVGWTLDAGLHRSADRKYLWQSAVDVVEGEESTPFQLTAIAADLASVVVNWGRGGMAAINADIDIAIARLPAAREIGLAARDRTEHHGITAGSALVFDRAGPIGTASVVALAGEQVVDPAARGGT